MSEPTIAPIVGNAHDFQNVTELLEEVAKLRRLLTEREKDEKVAAAVSLDEAISMLEELKGVIEKETWEVRPMQRAVISGVVLAIRELSGNKRAR